MTTTAATDADEPGNSTAAGTAGTSGAHPRFAEALDALGLGDLHPRIRRFPDATRTAAEAALLVVGIGLMLHTG